MVGPFPPARNNAHFASARRAEIKAGRFCLGANEEGLRPSRGQLWRRNGTNKGTAPWWRRPRGWVRADGFDATRIDETIAGDSAETSAIGRAHQLASLGLDVAPEDVNSCAPQARLRKASGSAGGMDSIPSFAETGEESNVLRYSAPSLAFGAEAFSATEAHGHTFLQQEAQG